MLPLLLYTPRIIFCVRREKLERNVHCCVQLIPKTDEWAAIPLGSASRSVVGEIGWVFFFLRPLWSLLGSWPRFWEGAVQTDEKGGRTKYGVGFFSYMWFWPVCEGRRFVEMWSSARVCAKKGCYAKSWVASKVGPYKRLVIDLELF